MSAIVAEDLLLTWHLRSAHDAGVVVQDPPLRWPGRRGHAPGPSTGEQRFGARSTVSIRRGRLDLAGTGARSVVHPTEETAMRAKISRHVMYQTIGDARGLTMRHHGGWNDVDADDAPRRTVARRP